MFLQCDYLNRGKFTFNILPCTKKNVKISQVHVLYDCQHCISREILQELEIIEN